MNTQMCLTDADLGRLWEGELTPQQRQSFERHIEMCASCRKRWEAVRGGGREIDKMFSEPPEATLPKTPCPSEETIVAYMNNVLGPKEREDMEDHLVECHTCRQQVLLARRFGDAYAQEGDAWWSEYVGLQVLHFLGQFPEFVRDILEIARAPVPRASLSEPIVALPILEPKEVAARRLAAAAGEGFAEQVLQQDDPPFEFHVVQFGKQARVTVRPLEERSPYGNCLAALRFFEGDTCALSRTILIENGQAVCVLSPTDTGSLRPEHGHLRLQCEPLVTLGQLAEAGSEAYTPIFERLLQHDDPRIRSSAVEVLARIRGPAAWSVIGPLLRDSDEAVRTAARKALNSRPTRGSANG